MQGYSIIIIVLVAGLIIWRRTRSLYRPIRGGGARMLIPLIILIPAAATFLNPELKLTTAEIGGALAAGLVLSIPLILTTNYEVRADGQIYARKSVGFIISLVGLLIIRVVLRDYLSDLDPNALAGLFVLIAVGYVIPWRIASYIKFRKVYAERGDGGAAGHPNE